MAGERKLPAVGKVISGTHGYFWWNNSICYEITSKHNPLRQLYYWSVRPSFVCE